MQTKEFQKRNETNEIFIPPGPRLGKQVLSVDNLEKSIEGKNCLIVYVLRSHQSYSWSNRSQWRWKNHPMRDVNWLG